MNERQSRETTGAVEGNEHNDGDFQFDVDSSSAPHYLEAFNELLRRPGVDVQSITFARLSGRPAHLTATFRGKDIYLVSRLGNFIEEARDLELAEGQDPDKIDEIVHSAATLIFDSREK